MTERLSVVAAGHPVVVAITPTTTAQVPRTTQASKVQAVFRYAAIEDGVHEPKKRKRYFIFMVLTTARIGIDILLDSVNESMQ